MRSLRAIGEAIGGAREIADLFAGCGTFGLPLAAGGGTVHAVEAEPAICPRGRPPVGASSPAPRRLTGRIRPTARCSVGPRALDLPPLDLYIGVVRRPGSPSSSGLGRQPLTLETGVRFP